MSNKKLILNHYDDDSEPESLIARCFQVSSDVKYREVPTTGEEYLLSVMRERENCAAVTRCKQDYSKFAKNQDCFIVEVKFNSLRHSTINSIPSYTLVRISPPQQPNKTG